VTKGSEPKAPSPPGTTASVAERKAYARRLLEAQQLADALNAYRALSESAENDPEVWHFFGIAHALSGNSAMAEQCFSKSVDCGSRSPYTHFNLAKLLEDRAAYPEAILRYQAAVELNPSLWEALNNLGAIFIRRAQFDKAVEFCERALRANPEHKGARLNLCTALQSSGRCEEALKCCREGFQLTHSDGMRVKGALVLPVIPDSLESVVRWRAHIADSIDELSTQKISVSDPVTEVIATQFYLAYHGMNNREIQEEVARLHLAACPGLSWQAPHCKTPRKQPGRIRVGFISSFMHDHSIGKTTRGLVEKLSRKKFELYALLVKPVPEDWTSHFIRDHADHWRAVPLKLEEARHQIADLELDILFYQDIGMDPFTYFLAFSRLAPIQCVTFGHPDTTGIPNMDYWVSNDLFEPAGAAEHYSERLFLLHDLPTLAYYFRPVLPESLKKRSAFGLPDDTVLYICPQMLFKFHPEFDSILATILRRNSAGRLVIIGAKTKNWTDLLLSRWRTTIPDVVDRVIVVPSQKQTDFLNLLAVCNVMLDTIHFNGMNSSLEGFAAGLPIVTMPTQLQRGRHTYGMYRKMGIEDCVARTPEEYVDIALRLGRDHEFRGQVKQRIAERAGVLYEDMNVVREFERFFLEAAEAVGLK